MSALVSHSAPLCNKSLCLWMFAVSGIGRATALALARCGAKVTAVTRTQADLNSLVQEVHTHPRHTHTHRQTHTHIVTNLRGPRPRPLTHPHPPLFHLSHCASIPSLHSLSSEVCTLLSTPLLFIYCPPHLHHWLRYSSSSALPHGAGIVRVHMIPEV